MNAFGFIFSVSSDFIHLISERRYGHAAACSPKMERLSQGNYVLIHLMKTVLAPF